MSIKYYSCLYIDALSDKFKLGVKRFCASGCSGYPAAKVEPAIFAGFTLARSMSEKRDALRHSIYENAQRTGQAPKRESAFNSVLNG